ncbi:uncharacterized protein LOC113561933 [Ooceraea biroi]|uniref:uncharacterized protein LOC113561933 n=1 Tax=Ooceraea biroi TaxID=2015173 RepID=UPI000F09650A|nr:uncharacterized protein LOC113561933 [Ooceraea biroi]
MAHNLPGEKSAWIPDLIGPIFKRDSLTLKQALDLRNADEQIHHMATFVPDEVLYGIDLSKKDFRRFQAVLMFLQITIATIAAINPDFGVQLRSYLMKPVIQQIEKSQSLEFLTEIRQITAISLDVIANKCPDHELILLADRCFILLHSIAAKYAGCINALSLYDKNILFCIVFGIRGSDNDDQFKINETCKNAVTCAIHMLQAVKNVAGIISAFVGVSTGMAYCGVIGHSARKHYAVIGLPIVKAEKIMDISYNKISCDHDTVLHSRLSKDQFRSRGVRSLQFEKCHIYDLDYSRIKKDVETSSLDYCYPILGRTHELECFDNILDDIGVADRNYSGLLIELQTKICILLDDIQYMNYKSWQFLSSALNNPNVIIVMTMLKPNSLKNLTDAEVEICKDERLTKCTLNGLEPNLLPVFACQFLNVLGISRKLKMDLQRCQDGRIDCCETFLTSILQNNALDFITIELSQLKKHDLFFPYISLVTKLPVDLTLEEQIPPLQWKQIKHLNVCIENKEYSNIYNVGDVKGRYAVKTFYFVTVEMMAEIYHKMNPYEQSLITCAATLGKVFKRYVLQNVMPNAILPHTNKGDASLVQYAHCKMLEFKVDLFRKVIYDMQSDAEKRDHHARIVKLYIQDARKCISCGGRNFLKIPSKEIFMEKESPIESARVSLTRRRSIVENQNDKWSLARRSVLSVSAIASRRPESSDTRRISLLPMYLDDEEDEGEMNEILDFVMEYSAGLIQTAQPLYAITLLTVATKRNEAAEKEESNLEENITNKRIILILMGLCAFLYVQDKLKVAQVAAIRSVKLGFPSADNFAEKGEIYLAAVQVLYRTKNMKLLREVERSMLAIIKVKTTWYDAEEIVMVANIYHTMYQTRALGGKLEEAVDMGIRVLKISVALHLNKLMLIIVPSLIEIMLWTKRINDAVDLMQQLFFLADSDIDLSARTWYYALSLELMLDAGIVLESYDSSYTYYKKFIAYRSKSCVMRDPQSLCRLMTCLWMYQIRMGYAVINSVECRMEEYMTDINYYNFAQIFSCCMRLECCLLILLRCVNLKNSTELLTLIQNTGKMIKCLNGISSHAAVVKPRLYLLVAYLYVIRGRKSSTRFYLHKAQKFASSQGNKMISAWIIQNKRTWIEKIYNNMAQYWLEYVESEDIVAWQYIRNFNIDTWSTILYSLSTPDAHV